MCSTVAPLSWAMRGICAAGWTTPDVPTDSSRSQSRAAANASRRAFSGSASPNYTTPGLIFPLQCGQRGGSIRAPASGTFGTGRACR